MGVDIIILDGSVYITLCIVVIIRIFCRLMLSFSYYHLKLSEMITTLFSIIVEMYHQNLFWIENEIMLELFFNCVRIILE